MDNYSYEEVKMLINKNLVTPEVFNNILKSTTRRLELYEDQDDLKILKYLSESKVVPATSKKEIKKYLDKYEKHVDINESKKEKTTKERQSTLAIIVSVLGLLIILCVMIIVGKR